MLVFFFSLISASHPEGLGIAIVGDDIYGQRDERLCLHAGFLQIDHPQTGKRITFTAPVPF
jgi:tRNA pseudouridine32 synthase/23S rRNA pseudouridine746 synthase